MRRMGMTALAAALLAAPGGRQGGMDPLTVRAVRFYSPASATTTIEGVCEVRLPVLLRRAGDVGRYHVAIAVLDSAGLELQHSDWTRTVPASLMHAASATMVESFAFSAAPGRYRVRISVAPAVGDTVVREAAVSAYAGAPSVSDLMLASDVRQPLSDSEVLGPGEVRRAGLVMRTAPVPRLSPTEATLSWYGELYARTGAGSGELVAEVIAGGGRRVVATSPQQVTIPAGGGLTRGSLDLTGLPAGEYTLRLRVRIGDTSVTAEAPFAMGSMTSAAAEVVAAGGTDATPAPAGDLFEGASELRLDSLAAPLVFVARNPQQLRLYQTLTIDGKRRFLRDFWSPTGSASRVEGTISRDGFYRAVAYANEHFGELGAGRVPGWNTDRGRIYLRNGTWDEILRRPGESAKDYTGFEVWKYTRDRQRWYVFADRTGMGHYQLLSTTDRHESGNSQVGWEGALGPQAAQEIYNFLGLDIRSLGNGGVNP